MRRKGNPSNSKGTLACCLAHWMLSKWGDLHRLCWEPSCEASWRAPSYGPHHFHPSSPELSASWEAAGLSWRKSRGPSRLPRQPEAGLWAPGDDWSLSLVPNSEVMVHTWSIMLWPWFHCWSFGIKACWVTLGLSRAEIPVVLWDCTGACSLEKSGKKARRPLAFLVTQMVKKHLQCRRPQFNSWVRKIP